MADLLAKTLFVQNGQQIINDNVEQNLEIDNQIERNILLGVLEKEFSMARQTKMADDSRNNMADSSKNKMTDASKGFLVETGRSQCPSSSSFSPFR